METIPFKPAQVLVGFWAPEPGAEIAGIVLDRIHRNQEKKPFYKLEILVGQRVRVNANGVTEVRESEANDQFGVSEWQNLKGLDKFVGHFVRIRCTGIKKTGRDRTMFEFETTVSKAPIARNEEEVDDGGVPF